MPKRRLQCGSCATVIKVSSRVQRPVCPRCSTAHTFIKCGRGECGTLMCLPENVNHFSCPRCNVQLARPGHTDRRSTPVAVRCGNTACDFLMTIPGNIGRFRCPRCSMEQLLPGTEEELKCKARAEEETRQQTIKKRQDEEVSKLCHLFRTMDPSVVEEVYDVYNKNRTEAFNKLAEMVGNGPEVTEALEEEVQRLHEVTHYKRQIVKTNIRCPITDKIMEDPVFAADGWSYERDAMASWLKSETVSPVTQGPLAHNRLTPNHQLKAQIIAWAEYEEMERTGEMGGEDDRQEELIMAVSGRVASLEAGGKEPEAFLDVMEAIEQVPAPASTVPQSPHGIVIPEFLGAELDAEAGAGQRAAGGRSPPGLVAARVASFQVDVDAGAKTGHV